MRIKNKTKLVEELYKTIRQPGADFYLGISENGIWDFYRSSINLPCDVVELGVLDIEAELDEIRKEKGLPDNGLYTRSDIRQLIAVLERSI